ncbi:hypothetical protein [Nonomuraea typhae]|uniref:hypothetical protein n=1 Tax=Nonomuraea typhae TaxID=2603600 RepID=UPI001CA59310|nr:hypothetical protein [Nonomuraea typhae]
MAGSRSLTRRTGPPLRRRAQPAALVLLAAAVAFCGWSGWASWQARADPRAAYAAERDRVLEAGRRHLTVLNTMDSAGAGLARWQDATTGPLREELAAGRERARQAVEQAGTTARASVIEAAVTALDQEGGDAQIIAAVEIEVTRPGRAASVERKRFQAGLARTGAGWKLKSFTAIPAVGE